MQRRKFLQGMLASAGATALPAPVIAKAAVQTTAKVVPFHYGWACVYAQMNNGVSAADIERVFNISAADGHQPAIGCDHQELKMLLFKTFVTEGRYPVWTKAVTVL